METEAERSENGFSQNISVGAPQATEDKTERPLKAPEGPEGTTEHSKVAFLEDFVKNYK